MNRIPITRYKNNLSVSVLITKVRQPRQYSDQAVVRLNQKSRLIVHRGRELFLPRYVQTDSVGEFFRESRRQGVKLIVQLHLVASFRMHGANPYSSPSLFPHISIKWCLMKHKNDLTFTPKYPIEIRCSVTSGHIGIYSKEWRHSCCFVWV